jgi:hypothetical protein
VIRTLSRPLPKKQISRLLIVDLVVIVILVAVPINSNYREYRLARTSLETQQQRYTRSNLAVRLARVSEQRIPGTLGEIRAARDILAAHTRRLRHVAESAAIQEQVRDLVGRRQLNFVSLRAQAATPYPGHHDPGRAGAVSAGSQRRRQQRRPADVGRVENGAPG